MKKNYRIKKSEDIEQIIKHKHSVGNKNYIIYIKENSTVYIYTVLLLLC